MPPRKRHRQPKGYRVFRDENGIHVHNQTTEKGHGVVFPKTVEPRIIYRALCACGQVFESGDQVKARIRLLEHIQNSMAKAALGIQPKKRE